MFQVAEDGAASSASADTAPLIALRGISRIHDGGAIAALKNVDLQIEAGDLVAIVGASGSGKSSLVNLLCGIDYPSAGTVLWEGRPVRSQQGWTRLTRAAAVLERVGLRLRFNHLVTKLSGGERQRVAIARAIVNEPKLLLADEPTGNLDSSSAANVTDLIFELCGKTGMTLILVTHDDALAARCARTIRIRDGAIVQNAAHAAWPAEPAATP
jgi:putative ABC transport system ATP-binding protein